MVTLLPPKKTLPTHSYLMSNYPTPSLNFKKSAKFVFKFCKMSNSSPNL